MVSDIFMCMCNVQCNCLITLFLCFFPAVSDCLRADQVLKEISWVLEAGETVATNALYVCMSGCDVTTYSVWGYCIVSCCYRKCTFVTFLIHWVKLICHFFIFSFFFIFKRKIMSPKGLNFQTPHEAQSGNLHQPTSGDLELRLSTQQCFTIMIIHCCHYTKLGTVASTLIKYFVCLVQTCELPLRSALIFSTNILT